MTHNPYESDPAPEPTDKLAVDQAGAVAERLHLNSELLRALAASVDRNERAQERFRYAVVRRLARLEARARVLQASEFVDPLKCCSVGRAAEQIEACEALISEMSEEIERKMLREISSKGDERGEVTARRGRPRKWSGWKI